MTGVKLFFKYFIYYFVWYFTHGNRSDSYYYDNELYVDVEKEFKRDLRFRSIERIIIVVVTQIAFFVIRLICSKNDTRTNTLYLVIVFLSALVCTAFMTITVFSVWSTVLKIKEIKSQS